MMILEGRSEWVVRCAIGSSNLEHNKQSTAKMKYFQNNTIFITFYAFLLVTSAKNALAFSTQSRSLFAQPSSSYGTLQTVVKKHPGATALLSSSPEGGTSHDEVATTSNIKDEVSVDATSTSDVPLNVPSPILLSSSMVLAIASTGSIFEIANGKASIPGLALTIVGIPTCFFLFYAAIKKGIAETEADDAEYNKKTNRF